MSASSPRVERALVERQLAAAVEGGRDAGRHAHRPGRGARVGAPRGVVAEGDGAAGGGDERVAPVVHRRGAGVRVGAGEAQPVALDAEAAEHDAERQAEPLQHRALLDVQLEVGGGAGRAARGPRRRGRGRRRGRRARRAATTPSRSVRPRTASGSSVPAQALDPSRLRPKRAPSSSAQSTSLTVTARCSPASARSTSSAADHAERPVEPAAVGHRVEVAADDHEALGVAGQRRPRVARRVAIDGHAGDRVQLGAQPVARDDPRVGPRHALGAALVRGEAGELAEALNGAGGVDHASGSVTS